MWFPPKPYPKLTSLDLLRATLEDLYTLLLNPPTDTYVGNMEQSQREELIRLSDIIHPQRLELMKTSPQPKDPTPTLGVPNSDIQTTAAPKLGVVTRSKTRHTQGQADRPSQHFSAPAVNPDTGNNAEYRELSTSSDGSRWKLGMCKELGRLFQGYKSVHPEHTVNGTNTCIFITPDDIPTHKKPTYIWIVAELRPHKADPY
jgi:hypothetical protein